MISSEQVPSYLVNAKSSLDSSNMSRLVWTMVTLHVLCVCLRFDASTFFSTLEF